MLPTCPIFTGVRDRHCTVDHELMRTVAPSVAVTVHVTVKLAVSTLPSSSTPTWYHCLAVVAPNLIEAVGVRAGHPAYVRCQGTDYADLPVAPARMYIVLVITPPSFLRDIPIAEDGGRPEP